jgi:hypothetical protein
MRIPGAGKSRLAMQYAERGFERLNRDERGGTLRALVKELEARLAAGAERVVLDNTYTTRAARSDVVRAAAAHGARVDCIFCDTNARDAEINVVLRMIARHGALLGPSEIATRARNDPGLVRPTVVWRMLRELERPALDEGFASIEVVAFERAARGDHTRRGAAIAIERVADLSGPLPQIRDDADATLASLPAGAACLVFGWRPEASEAWLTAARDLGAMLAERSQRDVDVAICAHAGGAPTCWCRPPLPGLFIAFAQKYGISAVASLLVPSSIAHETMGRALGLDVARID